MQDSRQRRGSTRGRRRLTAALSALVLVLSVATGCGGQAEPPAGANQGATNAWDQMSWDQGTWS